MSIVDRLDSSTDHENVSVVAMALGLTCLLCIYYSQRDNLEVQRYFLFV